MPLMENIILQVFENEIISDKTMEKLYLIQNIIFITEKVFL